MKKLHPSTWLSRSMLWGAFIIVSNQQALIVLSFNLYLNVNSCRMCLVADKKRLCDLFSYCLAHFILGGLLYPPQYTRTEKGK